MEGKNAGMNVKRLSIPLLFFFFEGWDSLTGVYFQHGFSVKQVQPVCKLHCSLG